MKLGMIVVFDANDEELVKGDMIDVLQKSSDIKFCLVNNNCSEMFNYVLMEIADECENVTVIHMKKNKGTSLAIRAGSRYMNSHFTLKFLGYITNLQGENLIQAIQVFANHHNEIRNQNTQNQLREILKPAFFKKAFSISNYYQQINCKLDPK